MTALSAIAPRPAALYSTEPVDWAISDVRIGYLEAVATMEARVGAISRGEAPELVWLLEHPALYSAGTSARMEDLLDPGRLPVFKTGRGGQFTYHGPGQRVAYCMLDLNRRGRDVRAFVGALEGWVIDTLAHFNVRGRLKPGLVGVFVERPEKTPGQEDKIAAIGIRLKRWVSLHGVSINVEPDLGNFDGIVPCGIKEHGVTSLADLGYVVTMADVDVALAATFSRRFGPIRRVAPPD